MKADDLSQGGRAGIMDAGPDRVTAFVAAVVDICRDIHSAFAPLCNLLYNGQTPLPLTDPPPWESKPAGQWLRLAPGHPWVGPTLRSLLAESLPGDRKSTR